MEKKRAAMLARLEGRGKKAAETKHANKGEEITGSMYDEGISNV